MTSCCGEEIKSAPCNCFGMKKYLCCGGPCYTACSGRPMFRGVKNGSVFLAHWDQASREYFDRNGIQESERAIFQVVCDSELDHKSANKVQPQQIGASATE